MKHITKKWLCLLFSFYTTFSFAQANVQDSLELIRFYQDVCIECPLVWDFSQPVETWEGVQVNSDRRVIRLDMDELGLNGTLADWNFPFLERLYLDDNQLTGEIPDFSGLPRLTFLDLHDNRLTGAIPDFAHLDSLERLEIGRNNLCNIIPNFSKLNKLEELNIGENNLIGNIPDFDNLPFLEELIIYDNDEITGTIPDFNLPKLIRLEIGRTGASGTIPNFSGMDNLTHLELEINELTGSIPDFSLLTSLERLYLYGNELTGNIPDFNISTLERIYLYSNELTGAIPAFENLPQLRRLNLSNNELTDSIPHFTNPLLEDILLYRNQLTGSIPDFTTLPNIEEIDLNDNLLSGCYPDNFNLFCNATIYDINLTDNPNLPNGGDMSLFCNSGLGTCAYSSQTDSLALVYFYENACSDCTFWDLNQPFDTWQGVVTDADRRVTELNLPNINLNGELVDLNLSELEKINLDSNKLSGNLPYFSNLQKLVELSLTDNQFSGGVHNYDLPNLQILELYNNQLSGEIPNFDKLPALIRLSLFGNQFWGFIPNFNLPNLGVLSLSHNHLEGNIPSFDYMPNLIAIGLNDNYLTGNIPSFSAQPNLLVIYLYNNNLHYCFTDDLQRFCGMSETLIQIHVLFQYFCNGISLCDGPVASSDSLELVRLYNETCNEGCSLNWDFDQPASYWSGVGVLEGRVEWLDLPSVGLSGTLPDLNLPYLGDLILEGNNLSGQIPHFTHLDSLGKLYLGDNDFEGEIPDFNLPKLAILNLNGNFNLEGELPKFEALTDMYRLQISGTGISGSIPNYSHMTELYELDLSVNGLTGQIPNFNLPYLETLDLSSNRILGSTIPDFDSLPMLKILNLRYAKLTDSIPDFQSLDSLEVLSLDYNDLTGTIPNFSNLPNLLSLDVAVNNLNGTIPDFSNLPNLENLYLDDNNLSGAIPDLSSLLKLQQFRIDENYFTFDEIKNYYDINTIEDFEYSPQKYGNKQFYNNPLDTTVILSPDPSIPYANVSVKWLKGDKFIDTNYVLHDTIYTIDTLTIPDIGVYQYYFTDFTLSPLVEFQSAPINNYIEGLDLEGEPIIKNELIIEYGRDKDLMYIDSVQTELRNTYNGEMLDSCGCAVRLELWKFNSDTIDIVREIIGTDNDREKRTSSDSGIDGGQNRENILIPNYYNSEQIIVSPYTESYENDTTQIIIGVIDTGIDTNHIEIKPNLWSNIPELNGTPGIDDDGNGCIDDIYGYDFINRFEMNDEHGHGTQVGGVIAANVPEGMNISVMPVKTFNQNGKGTLFDFICGIYYAIENQADIVNISAGYKGQQSLLLRKALQYGRDKGVSFVFASGNETLDLDEANYWPAVFSRDVTLDNNIITVTAIDTTNSIMDYANYGASTVNIAALGQDVLTPYIGTKNYEYLTGTSVSSPLVALALGIEKLQDPNRDYVTLRRDFLNSMDTLPELACYVKGGYYLQTYIEKRSLTKVFLEGAITEDADTMRTTLNQRGLLPGQDPISEITTPTPAGHPYNIIPWNYTGKEGENIRVYADNRVDWVLLSLRTGIGSDTEIYRTATQLRDDGTVVFYCPIPDATPMPDSVYIVIEHRNHMAVMSPQKVPVLDGRAVYDFTKQDSYRDDTSYGQVEIRPGVWAMIAGDGLQEDDYPFYDINGIDKTIWIQENGSFDLYLPSDYDLNGDVNEKDKLIWSHRNGISNRIPK